MNLQLTDEQAAALERELDRIIRDDRYPLSPRNRDAKGDPRQAATETGTATFTAAEILRAAASRDEKTMAGVRIKPGSISTPYDPYRASVKQKCRSMTNSFIASRS